MTMQSLAEHFDAETATIGHNSGDVRYTIEVRMFNRISRLFGDGQVKHFLTIDAGTTVGDVLAKLKIPENEVFLAFINGTDISHEAGSLRLQLQLEEHDVLALSGAIPYSWGYGAPVV